MVDPAPLRPKRIVSGLARLLVVGSRRCGVESTGFAPCLHRDIAVGFHGERERERLGLRARWSSGRRVRDGRVVVCQVNGNGEWRSDHECAEWELELADRGYDDAARSADLACGFDHARSQAGGAMYQQETGHLACRPPVEHSQNRHVLAGSGPRCSVGPRLGISVRCEGFTGCEALGCRRLSFRSSSPSVFQHDGFSPYFALSLEPPSCLA